MKNKYFFMLFSDCILVDGKDACAIYDLSQYRFCELPKIMYEILTAARILNIGDLKKKFENKFDEGIDRYFENFCSDEWGRMLSADLHSCFPDLSLEYESYLDLINVSMVISSASIALQCFEKVMNEISTLNCETLLFFFEKSLNNTEINQIFEIYGEFTNIVHLEIVLEDKKQLDGIDWKKVHALSMITILNCNKKDIVEENSLYYIYEECSLEEFSSCKRVSQFVINKDFFIESKHFNNCLNKKLAINEKGEILNCHNGKFKFGNIQDTTIRSVIKRPEFTKMWHIKKDDIDICKECEKRYMCMDCRVHTLDANEYSRPIFCPKDSI